MNTLFLAFALFFSPPDLSTVKTNRVLSFDEAVRASLRMTNGCPHITVDIYKDGSLTIANRPIQLAELKNVLSVSGLSEYPPAVLFRAHQDSSHPHVKAVLDELIKIKIVNMSCGGINREDWIRATTYDENYKIENAQQLSPAGTNNPAKPITGGSSMTPPKPASPFDTAVKASLVSNKYVVLMVDQDGSLFIGGVSVKMNQIKDIRTVVGLPNNPPSIIVRVHEKATSHANLTLLYDELQKSGILDVGSFSVSPEAWERYLLAYQQKSPSDNQ